MTLKMKMKREEERRRIVKTYDKEVEPSLEDLFLGKKK
jgi:hypothetical protein